MQRSIIPHLWIGLGIAIFMALLMVLSFPPFETLEEKLYDFRFKTRGAMSPPPDIVIAAIDERSVASLGRWPWDREVIARLVDRLKEAKAAVIAFDIIFCESERHDRRLARSVGGAGNVLLPVAFVFSEQAEASTTSTFHGSALAPCDAPLLSHYEPITAPKVLVPVAQLSQQASTLGHINMFPDGDGTLRREALAIQHDGRLYPSLTLSAAALFLGVPKEKIVLEEGKLQLGTRAIPTDPWLRTLINYYGPAETFPHLPVSDILDRKVPSEKLSGKIVLIGATAVGIYDLRVTPFSPAMPGVEKHASVIASILDGRPLSRVSTIIDLAALFSAGILLALAISRLRPWSAVIATCAAMALFGGAAYYLFLHGWWINTAYPAGAMLLTFVGTTAYNYAVEEKYARRIRAMFSSYVTQTIVNELIGNPGMAKLGGERREITVLFSDIRGFTNFAEHHSPEQVVAQLNEYLEAMTDVVMEWGGTLDKFIGDAIVAFWNAPSRQDGHAGKSVQCALAMNRRLKQLQEKWAREGKWVLDAGIGINTGEALVGNIGAEGKKMDYTVIGDQVNLGARVESLTRRYDTPILITENTLARLRPEIAEGGLRGMAIEGLEKVVVKGKEKPVTLYKVSALEDAGAKAMFTECRNLTPVRLGEK